MALEVNWQARRRLRFPSRARFVVRLVIHGLKETSLSERKLERCWLSWSNPSRITVHRIFRARGVFLVRA
jgi:hypothetical protein